MKKIIHDLNKTEQNRKQWRHSDATDGVW